MIVSLGEIIASDFEDTQLSGTCFPRVSLSRENGLDDGMVLQLKLAD
jgi:hypothetical protein